MSFSFQPLMSRLVLISFLFQTLWPSLAFARTEIPLGSAWSDESCGLTFKAQPFRDPITFKGLLKIEAYITEAGEERGKEGPRGGGKEANPWSASPVSPVPSSSLSSTPLSGTTPPASFLPSPSVPSTPLSGGSTPASEGSRTRPAPSPLSLASSAPRPSAPPAPPSDVGSELSSAHPESSRASTATSVRKLLERVVDRETLEDVESGLAVYSDLSRTAEGVSWAFGGLAFVLDKQGNLLATGVANSDMPVILCTPGTVALDNATVGQVLARGQGVVVRGTGRVGRLDAWATGRGWSPGIVRITEGSTQHIGQLYVHQGQGENDGHLTIEQSLNHQGNFENHASLQMEGESVVRGGGVFWNQHLVGGESYTLQSHVIRNQKPPEPQRAARPEETGEGEEAKEAKEPEEAERKKATLTATKSVTLTAQRLEHYGDVAAPSVELAVGGIEDGNASTVKAVRLKTALKTSWDSRGTIETNDWVDESDRTVRIVNAGTLTTHTSAAFSGQFETGQGGVSHITGLSLAPPLLIAPPPLPPQPAPQTLRQRIGQAQPAPQPVPQPWVNRGTTTLRHVRSLGDPRRAIVNEEGAELSFLEGGYSRTHGDFATGGLTIGDITNRGTISFGRGSYHTKVFTNHHVHKALAGQDLWSADFINHGRTEFGNDYRVDMTRGPFTRLGQMVGTAGNLTIQFGTGVNIAQYLTDNGVQSWRLPGKLRVGGGTFHNRVDLGLGVPFYLWVASFLNDAQLHTRGLYLTALTFGQGTLGGRLGDIKSSGPLRIEVEGDVNNQRGRIEAEGGGRVISQKGNILVGQGVGGPKRARNGAFIFSDKRLALKGRNIQVRFGEVGSNGPLTLQFLEQFLVEAGVIKAMGETIFQGRSLVIRRADPWRNTNVTVREPRPCMFPQMITVPNPCGPSFPSTITWVYPNGTPFPSRSNNLWLDQWRQEEGGDDAQVLVANAIRLLVEEAVVTGGDIAAMGDVTDRHGTQLTKERPGVLDFRPMEYYQHADARIPSMTVHELFGTRLPTFSCSGKIDLNFALYQLANLLMSAAAVSMTGDRGTVGSETSRGSAGAVVPSGSVPLLPALLSMVGGITQYRSARENPYVIFSTGSWSSNIIDPNSLTLVSDAMTAAAWLSSPSSGYRQLRQITDEEGLITALQIGLMAKTRRSYIYPRQGAREHIRRMIQNARELRGDRPYLPRAEAERSKKPLITVEVVPVRGERGLAHVAYVPKDFVNTLLFESSRGTLAADEDLRVVMSTHFSLAGGSLGAGRDIDIESKTLSLTRGVDTHVSADGRSMYQAGTGGRVVGGHAIRTVSDDNTTLAGVRTSSGVGGTAMQSTGGHLIDGTVVLQSHQETHQGDTRTTTDTATHAVSQHESKGHFSQTAAGVVTAYAHQVSAPTASLRGNAGVSIRSVHNTSNTTSVTREDGGLFGGSSETRTATQTALSVAPVYDTDTPVEVAAASGPVQIPSDLVSRSGMTFTIPRGALEVIASFDWTGCSHTETDSSMVWQSVSHTSSVSSQYVRGQIGGPVRVRARDGVVIETVRGKTLEWLARLDAGDSQVIQRELLEEYRTHHFEHEGPTMALAAVITLAVTIATSGTGAAAWAGNGLVSALGATGTSAAVISTMGAAAFTGLCAQSANAIWAHRGNIGRAAQQLARGDSIRSLLITTGSAGLARGVGTIPARIAVGLARRERLGDIAAGIAVDQAARFASTQIGQSGLGGVGQTALQTGVGAGMGALMGGRDGAISAATAAAAAYTLATAVSPDAATPDDLQTAANVGRLGAAATAMMLRHDVGIAIAAAANAMDGFMVSRLTASAPAAGTASPIVEEVEAVPAARPAPSRVVDEEVEEVPATRAELEDRRERRGEERRGRSQVRADHALTLAALDRASAEVDAARSFVHRASDEAPQPTARDRHVAHGLALAKSQRKQSLSPDTRRTVAEVYGEQYDPWFQEAGERRGQLMGLSMMATTMATGGAGLAAGAVVAGGFGGVMALDEQASREHLFGDGGSGPSVVRSMVTEAATVYVGGKVVGAVVSRAAPVVQRMAGRVAGVGTGQVVPPTAVMQQSAPLGGAGAAPRPALAERLSAAIARGVRAEPSAPRPAPAAAPSTQPQRHIMFEGEGTGVGAAPIPVSRPATTATLTTAPASSTGGGNVPGIDKPFRPANPAHPPNAAVVERMNSLQPHHNMDCSEIADTLQRTAGGGRILHVTGRGGKDLKLFENGQISAPEFAYHQVFTDGRYIYDPLLSKTAVPLGDWECFIRTLNPGALIK